MLLPSQVGVPIPYLGARPPLMMKHGSHIWQLASSLRWNMVREAMKLNAANQKRDQRKQRLEELQTELLEAQAEERVAALLIDEMKRSLPALPVI